MTHRVYRSLAVSLLVFVASCAQIPTAELAQYRSASAEVQKAAEGILIDFAAIKEASEAEQKRKEAEKAAPKGPVLFSTALEYSSVAQPDAVTVRRTALRTIDNFNNTLATLAEGKSVEAVQTAAGGAVEAANNFIVAAGAAAVPGLGALIGVVKTLVGELEKAGLREEFDKAVRNGTPTILKMLEALIAERQDHITLRAIAADNQQVKLVDEMISQVQILRTLVREHSPPASGDPRQDIENALNAALKPVERVLTSPLPIRLSYQDKTPPFASEHRLLAEQAVAQITERGAAINANTEQFEKLRSALNNYGAMLRRMQDALGMLVSALDRPQKFDKVSEDLFGIAFSLKKDIEGFRAARKGSN
ncbi:MAG: hypothetical protein A3H91_12225 [Gammaproteobacteria bacterium RIFCSPLOWO2_02_FULL_61_13]|nr:MAG: hypothetical protein A3H91_12225 [Gammaproteobacteria bacterium RIFCSPLOWO2_02_FULL_61_13]